LVIFLGIDKLNIKDKITNTKKLILQAEEEYNRPLNVVKLMAVSKGRTSSEIKEAFAAGITDFGESYLQEAKIKIEELNTLPICWHFIGKIQSNKINDIANKFSWVQSVSRIDIAKKLNDLRELSKGNLNVCIQVNIDNEESKSGVPPAEVKNLAKYILSLPNLNLRGLMTIPKQKTNEEEQFNSFFQLTNLMQNLNQQLSISMDTLSMGMSNDFKAAIRANSSMVRIGTALFGERR